MHSIFLGVGRVVVVPFVFVLWGIQRSVHRFHIQAQNQQEEAEINHCFIPNNCNPVVRPASPLEHKHSPVLPDVFFFKDQIYRENVLLISF